MRNINAKGLQLIKDFEGCRLSCYHLGDGKCTIGYGHTRPVYECCGEGNWKISQNTADVFLELDVQKYARAVESYFSRNFNDNQFAALVSFCYNLGTGIFAQYNWGREETDKQITDRMILYVNPPQFREGLTRRRKAEIALYNTPMVGSVDSGYIFGHEYTIVADCLNVRFEPSTQATLVPQTSLTPMAKAHSNGGSGLLRGTVITCLEVAHDSDNNTWIKIPSGWIAGIYRGEVYVQ